MTMRTPLPLLAALALCAPMIANAAEPAEKAIKPAAAVKKPAAPPRGSADRNSMPLSTRPTTVMLRSSPRGAWPITAYSSAPVLESLALPRPAPTVP